MKPALLLSLLLATPAWAASAPPSDNVLVDLSRCDRTFFETLRRHSIELASNPHFATGPNYAYFKVADRTNAEHSLRKFSPPLKLGSMDVIGYFDELMNMGENSTFVAWGFLLRAPIGDVIKTTQSLLWDNARLQQDGQIYARSEVWDQAQQETGWQKVVTPGASEPQPGTVERVLMIEPYEKDPALTRFGCSLQGAVTREMLRDARPDIEGKTP
jgi:hypothetical protein